MLPVSWLANMVISAFNLHVGGNLAGSSCNDIEESLMKWLVSKIGSPSEEATGLTVSEGSMANLMALAAARGQVVSGPQDHHQAVIYVSEKSHFSIAKTARVLGFSEKQIRNVPNFQPECLASLVRDDRALGLIPTDQVGKMLDHGVEMAETAEAALRARAHWKIISPAELAILVFRFEPNGHTEPEMCQLNDKITDVALDKNIVAIQTVRFRGRLAMRMCIIDLRLTAEQLVTIINALDKIAIRLSL
jgi:glutamate/tyrosine decarboxylase-like PLP-dependent enzyme